MIDDNIDDSPMPIDELRARVHAQYGDGSDLARTAEERALSAKSRKKRTPEREAAIAAAASKRTKTGKSFEEDLDDTHEGMFNRGEGLILKHHPPTKYAGKKGFRVLIRGGANCDYSGHVNVMKSFAGVPLTRSVVFDAKVLGAEHATYTHDKALVHQLLHLRRAHEAGALAFLLVRADAIGRVFVVSFANHGEEMIRGRGVTLFEQRRNGWATETRLGRTERIPRFDAFLLLPACEYTPGKGWLWSELALRY